MLVVNSDQNGKQCRSRSHYELSHLDLNCLQKNLSLSPRSKRLRRNIWWELWDHFFIQNIFCGYSLEVPPRGTSDDCKQNICFYGELEKITPALLINTSLLQVSWRAQINEQKIYQCRVDWVFADHWINSRITTYCIKGEKIHLWGEITLTCKYLSLFSMGLRERDYF